MEDNTLFCELLNGVFIYPPAENNGKARIWHHIRKLILKLIQLIKEVVLEMKNVFYKSEEEKIKELEEASKRRVGIRAKEATNGLGTT